MTGEISVATTQVGLHLVNVKEKKGWKELNVRLDRRGQKLEREREEHRTIEGRRESSVIFFFGSRAVAEEKSLFSFPNRSSFQLSTGKVYRNESQSQTMWLLFFSLLFGGPLTSGGEKVKIGND